MLIIFEAVQCFMFLQLVILVLVKDLCTRAEPEVCIWGFELLARMPYWPVQGFGGSTRRKFIFVGIYLYRSLEMFFVY